MIYLSPRVKSRLSILSLALFTSFLFYCVDNLNHLAHAVTFNFAAVGDFGCNANTDATVTNIVGKSPELVIGLGDYSYQATADCWLGSIQPIDSITKINIGNHEDEASESFDQYMNHFGLSQPYYSYDYQNVHILTMMFEPTFRTSHPQFNFVVNDLEAASQDPNIDWIIVSVHDWVYRSSSTNPLNDDFAEIYHPIFDQYGVDLVLSGHDHNYLRTYPLKFNPNNHLSPIITNNNTNDYVDPTGEIYVVVGTGGINLTSIVGTSPFVRSQQDDFFGQLDIRFTDNGGKLEGRFYKNDDNAILDTFSITKNATGAGTYHFPPSLVLSGSNYQDEPNFNRLQLSQFSVAAWFKTSSNFGSNAFIVNKGGIGSDIAGQNMNYGIWMTSSEKIQAGFEAVNGGADHFVTSPNTYNDGQWHYAVVTYDGSAVILYIDGVQIATKSTSGASPETIGTKPVRVGANSRVTPPGNFFAGEVDEVRVWNDALSAQEVFVASANTVLNTGEQSLHLPFGFSPPIAHNLDVALFKNTSKTITIAATDLDNSTLIYEVVTQPQNGTLSGAPPNLIYDPATDFIGTDSFTFNANDGTTDSNIAIVTMTVLEPGQIGKYRYAPGFNSTGSNYHDVPGSRSLQLSQFSVAAWFKTSINFFGTEAFIVNKGGIGSDSAGQNMNYQISMTISEKIKAGFEAVNGADHFVTSSKAYGDGQWHYAIVTYDGSTVILYIDGVQVATKSTSGVPPDSSGTKPVRMGANSGVTPPTHYFTGEIDEVRVWNDDLTTEQVADAFVGSSFNTAEQVLYLNFSSGSR